jgi:phosphatidylglycerol lysyltransferase
MHTEDKNKNLYKNLGLEMQKIGEEAIVDTAHFVKSVMPNKYFRHIANRFERQKFTTEILLPPHSQELLHRLHQVSNDWLGAPGRVERGFMMGYFTDEYIQQCSLMVARNKAGVIHAFLNQLPIINSQEVSFDFLRNTGGGPGNINDYLMA